MIIEFILQMCFLHVKKILLYQQVNLSFENVLTGQDKKLTINNVTSSLIVKCYQSEEQMITNIDANCSDHFIPELRLYTFL